MENSCKNNFVDYYPGGSPMPGRNFNQTSYRYGFNKGSEKDDEISGAGNHFTTKYREGDTRLMTWWSVDPEADEQPWQSPYSYMDGNPIQFNDPDGDCPWCVTALIGGLIEGGIELGGQVLSGKSLSEVDWADVGVEFGKGAVTGSGAGLLARGVAEVGGAIIKAGVDVSASEGVKTVGNGKSLTAAGVDLTLDVVGGKIAGAATAKLAKVTSAGVKAATKEATQAGKAITKSINKANKIVGETGGYGVKATVAKQAVKDAAINSQNANGKKAAAKIANAVAPKASRVVGEAATNKATDKAIKATDGK